MASVPGIVEGIELGERAEELEPNNDLRTRISMAVSLLRNGPSDS